MSVAFLKYPNKITYIHSRLQTDLLAYVWHLAMTYHIFVDNAVMKVIMTRTPYPVLSIVRSS